MRQTEFGCFVNAQNIRVNFVGYTRTCGLWSTDIWDYRAHRLFPLTFVDVTGNEWRPDNHFASDFGSIPPFLNGFPSLTRTRFLGPYLLHDSARRYGGLWHRAMGQESFSFVALTMLDGDRMLRDMVGAWGGNAAQRAMIYRGVRIGSPFLAYPTGDIPEADIIRIGPSDASNPR